MSNTQQDLIGWILAGAASVVSTLSGLVAYFYRTQIAEYKSTESGLKSRVEELNIRANDCEKDRGELKVRCAVLEERMDKVESKEKA